jgi:hypothetical protein
MSAGRAGEHVNAGYWLNGDIYLGRVAGLIGKKCSGLTQIADPSDEHNQGANSAPDDFP